MAWQLWCVKGFPIVPGQVTQVWQTTGNPPEACKRTHIPSLMPASDCGWGAHLFQFVRNRSVGGNRVRSLYGAAAHLVKSASALPGLRSSETAVRQAAAASPRAWCRLLRSSELPAGDASEWGTTMGRIVK